MCSLHCQGERWVTGVAWKVITIRCLWWLSVCIWKHKMSIKLILKEEKHCCMHSKFDWVCGHRKKWTKLVNLFSSLPLYMAILWSHISQNSAVLFQLPLHTLFSIGGDFVNLLTITQWERVGINGGNGMTMDCHTQAMRRGALSWPNRREAWREVN